MTIIMINSFTKYFINSTNNSHLFRIILIFNNFLVNESYRSIFRNFFNKNYFTFSISILRSKFAFFFLTNQIYLFISKNSRINYTSIINSSINIFKSHTSTSRHRSSSTNYFLKCLSYFISSFFSVSKMTISLNPIICFRIFRIFKFGSKTFFAMFIIIRLYETIIARISFLKTIILFTIKIFF